jgi:hypothetical protein
MLCAVGGQLLLSAWAALLRRDARERPVLPNDPDVLWRALLPRGTGVLQPAHERLLPARAVLRHGATAVLLSEWREVLPRSESLLQPDGSLLRRGVLSGGVGVLRPGRERVLPVRLAVL